MLYETLTRPPEGMRAALCFLAAPLWREPSPRLSLTKDATGTQSKALGIWDRGVMLAGGAEWMEGTCCLLTVQGPSEPLYSSFPHRQRHLGLEEVRG